MKSFYFKPTKSELIKEQVIGLVEVSPDQTSEDILLSYGLFPIKDAMSTKGVLDNPQPVYIDKGTYYLKCPSLEDIDLEEGKFIVGRMLCKEANSSLESLANEFGLSAFVTLSLPLLKGSEESTLLSEFRNRQSMIISNFNKDLMKVEKAQKIDDLRKILDP